MLKKFDVENTICKTVCIIFMLKSPRVRFLHCVEIHMQLKTGRAGDHIDCPSIFNYWFLRLP